MSRQPLTDKKPLRAKVKSKSQISAGPEYLPKGACKAVLPVSLAPQLATLFASSPLKPQGWIYEIKFDGYRLMTRIDGDSIKYFTRNGHDWTARLPALVKAISQMGISSAWLDGEIVVLDDQGIPDFGALQNAFDSDNIMSIVYFVFDPPWLDCMDLRQVKLAERREILRSVLIRNQHSSIRFIESFEHPP